MVDGFKPGQRKIMFACFKRNLKKDIKARRQLPRSFDPSRGSTVERNPQHASVACCVARPISNGVLSAH